MLPNVFLSLAGQDESFVSKVEEHLPDGLAHFYPKSFATGELLLEAMERRVEGAAIFALFASKKSLESVWVKFEIDRARISKIQHPGNQILIFIIDPQITPTMLPEWMKEYWIGNVGSTPRDIARYIRRKISLVSRTTDNFVQIFGRGALLDTASRTLQDAVLKNGETPNVFLFAGHSGIGRRTVQNEFFVQAFNTLPMLSFGPPFELAQFADLLDLYLALSQELDVNFSISKYTEDSKIFKDLDLELQAEEVVEKIKYFGKLGQCVTFVTGNGIYEDRGTLKAWVPYLFNALATDRRLKVAFITNRMIHPNELRPHPNVIQIDVPSIQDADVRALIIAAAPAFGASPQLPNESVIKAIGGHPGIARTVASSIARQGLAIVNNDLRDVFRLQEETLNESLVYDALTVYEKDILCILSWVPKLNGIVLKSVLVNTHNLSNETFSDSVGNLLIACLMLNSGENYLISEPMRGLYRRRHGYGAIDLRNKFASVLREQWRASVNDDEMRSELFDALAFMAALEGGTLSAEFQDLLLPSTLQAVVRETYNRGHEDETAFRLAVNWGIVAKTMRMDETTREEILSYVVRAQTRLNDRDALETLKFIDQRGYRSRFYLRSFYLRHSGGDLRIVIDLLKEARSVRKYMDRVIADLALCYQRLGRWRELAELIREEERRVDSDPQLLDLKIGMLLSQGDFSEAEKAIEKLRNLPREGGRADARTARMLMQRGNPREAQRLLTRVLQSGGAGQSALRVVRAVAAAQAGDAETARRDAEFLKARPGGRDMVARIEAHIALASGQHDRATENLDSVSDPTVQDYFLRARILDAQASDAVTGLADRRRLQQEAATLRARYRMADEYHFDH